MVRYFLTENIKKQCCTQKTSKSRMPTNSGTLNAFGVFHGFSLVMMENFTKAIQIVVLLLLFFMLLLLRLHTTYKFTSSCNIYNTFALHLHINNKTGIRQTSSTTWSSSSSSSSSSPSSVPPSSSRFICYIHNQFLFIFLISFFFFVFLLLCVFFVGFLIRARKNCL